jgi:ligand-binding SRPBCC domain-containing protein
MSLVKQIEIVTSSNLGASPGAVWRRVTTMDGINHELRPWMRMTSPRGAELTVGSVPLGKAWFRSWILLFGVLPFDFDDLRLERLEEERGFLERSRMLSTPVWEHERTLEPLAGETTRLTDRVGFLPRARALAPLHRAVIAAMFRHRHHRLTAYFGEV